MEYRIQELLTDGSTSIEALNSLNLCTFHSFSYSVLQLIHPKIRVLSEIQSKTYLHTIVSSISHKKNIVPSSEPITYRSHFREKIEILYEQLSDFNIPLISMSILSWKWIGDSIGTVDVASFALRNGIDAVRSADNTINTTQSAEDVIATQSTNNTIDTTQGAENAIDTTQGADNTITTQNADDTITTQSADNVVTIQSAEDVVITQNADDTIATQSADNVVAIQSAEGVVTTQNVNDTTRIPSNICKKVLKKRKYSKLILPARGTGDLLQRKRLSIVSGEKKVKSNKKNKRN